MKTVLFVYALAITTACTTDEPATSDVESKLANLDCSTPGWGFEVEDDVVDLAFESDLGCDEDPFGSPWGGGGLGGGDGFDGGPRFCPTQQKTGSPGSGSSDTSEDEARASARASAFESARNQCFGWFYYPVAPSYCEGGFEQAFTISDSCLRPYPELYPNYWRCSATASVTCGGYTWHAW